MQKFDDGWMTLRGPLPRAAQVALLDCDGSCKDINLSEFISSAGAIGFWCCEFMVALKVRDECRWSRGGADRHCGVILSHRTFSLPSPWFLIQPPAPFRLKKPRFK